MDRQVRNRRLAARFGIGLCGVGLLLALVLPFAGSAGAASEGSAGAASGLPSGGSAGSACLPANVITAYHFTINGKPATTLHNVVHEGDSVEAWFTIAAGCKNIPVALTSHTMPDNTFVPSHASQQKVFDSAKGPFSAGDHTLGPVTVPPCNFQVDFAALEYQGNHGHTYSSAVGGTKVCSGSPPAPATTECTTANNIGVTLFPMSPPASETYTIAVAVNGQTTTDTVTVTDTQVTHSYPVPEDTPATVTVTNESGETVLSQTLPHDCSRPSASVTHQCVAGTTGSVVVQATNEGSQPKTFTILKNGTPVSQLTVAPFSTGSATVAMAEGETATWTVTGPEGVSTTPLSVTNSCTQVLPIVITAPSSSGPSAAAVAPASATGPEVLGASQTTGTLAATGARTNALLGLALGLMVIGGMITLAARRSLRSPQA
jgi:hypothetical protein